MYAFHINRSYMCSLVGRIPSNCAPHGSCFFRQARGSGEASPCIYDGPTLAATKECDFQDSLNAVASSVTGIFQPVLAILRKFSLPPFCDTHSVSWGAHLPLSHTAFVFGLRTMSSGSWPKKKTQDTILGTFWFSQAQISKTRVCTTAGLRKVVCVLVGLWTLLLRNPVLCWFLIFWFWILLLGNPFIIAGDWKFINELSCIFPHSKWMINTAIFQFEETFFLSFFF